MFQATGIEELCGVVFVHHIVDPPPHHIRSQSYRVSHCIWVGAVGRNGLWISVIFVIRFIKRLSFLLPELNRNMEIDNISFI